MALSRCYGNGADVTISPKILLDKRSAKIFIVCLHGQKSFFVIFHRFKRIIRIENPFEPP